jgi:hypothetical protein
MSEQPKPKTTRCMRCGKGPPTLAVKPDNPFEFYEWFCFDCDFGMYYPENHTAWALGELCKKFKTQPGETK